VEVRDEQGKKLTAGINKRNCQVCSK